ncbi:MAG: ABC transporter permease subunit [Acidobacteriota bacterium]|jgi:ABC-type transport system involved in multi-copper enzyme maturation permease subunit
MFITLLKKEILDYLVSIRFLVLTALCVLLIPLSLYVNFETYRRWSADYNEQLKIESSMEGHGSRGYHGVRQPSPLSVFANGIETSLPKDFSLDDKQISFGIPRSYGDPIYEIFGRIDFLFVVQTVLSLVALLFAFDSVSGEKELGTLKLTLANPVPRHQVLLGKFVGGMIILGAPLLLSFALGLAVLTVSGYPLFQSGVAGGVLWIFGLAVAYVAVFFLAGLLVSTLTHQSKTALILLMFVWVVLVLGAPRLSIMAAKVIRPVDDDSVVLLRSRLLTDTIEKEKGNALKSLYFEKAKQKGLSNGQLMFDRGDPEFVRRRFEIAGPFETRLRAEVARLEEDQQRRKQAQLNLAHNLSRVSPASILSYLMTDLADTGDYMKVKFLDAVRSHYASMDRLVFSKSYSDSISDGNSGWGFNGDLPGSGVPKSKDLPVFSLSFPRRADTIAASIPDLGLLIGYAALLFAGATVAFLKYDVR